MIEMLLLVLTVNVLGLYFFIQFARKKQLVDKPNERSSHNIPTVRGGGIMLAPTFIFGVLYFSDTHILAAVAILLGAWLLWQMTYKIYPLEFVYLPIL